MPYENSYLEKLNKSHLNPYATALIRAAAEESRTTSDQTFKGALDREGQHLIFEVHYDPSFWVDGDDESPDAIPARKWVRLQVRDPQYNLSLMEVWVDLSDGRLNIDDETASEEARNGAVAAKAAQLANYLHDVLLPAIRTRIAVGQNPDILRCAKQSPTK
jgi:hypothetical protein